MKRSNLFKRSAAMLLAGLMAVSMSACGGSSASGNDSGDSQASSSGDTHKLSVVLKTTSSEYWSYVIAGIEQAEKDLGNVEVDVRGANSDTDFDGQLNMVETIVNADMCEAIAIAPLQADQIANALTGVKIPVLTFILIALLCLFIVWFRKTKLGQDMRAVGQDMEVARDAGINVERTRVISMVISTVFAGFGMIIYLQNVGNFPTYTAHTQIGMFSIAALLVGGASVEKASIKNVFLGVILFHTMFIVAPRTGTVITGDSMIGEYFRVFVSYAVITIALVMYEAKKRKAKSAAGLQLAADQLAEEEAKAK